METCAYTHCANKQFILEAMKLADKLLRTADEGILTCKDDSCLALYGVIRDCGYKIRRTVEQEQDQNLQKGNLRHSLQ
jgi:hypothetical protein